MQTVKGRTKTEYLLIFSIILLIAFVAGIVVAGLAEINGGLRERESVAYWKNTDVSIPAFRFSTNQSRCSITFRNNNNYAVRIDGVQLGDRSMRVGSVLFPGTSTSVVGDSALLCMHPGERQFFTVTIFYSDPQTDSRSMVIGEKQLMGPCRAN